MFTRVLTLNHRSEDSRTAYIFIGNIIVHDWNNVPLLRISMRTLLELECLIMKDNDIVHDGRLGASKFVSTVSQIIKVFLLVQRNTREASFII